MKKLLTVTLALLLTLTLCLPVLTSCGKAENENVIRIGATATPHAEILNQVKAALAEKGYTLEIVEYDDYALLNPALADGELDANYFQHTPYLNAYNAEKKADLVSAGLVHYEPFGIYGNGITSLKDLSAGATIIIPNDGSNETRALMLLAQEGLITLKEGVTAADNLTTLDIVENKGNYAISEVAADQVPAQLKNSDTGSIAVINGNYALAAKLKIADALASEDASGEAAQTYANVVAVRKGDEKSAKILALMEALQSQAVVDYINATYNGTVVAIH